MDDRTEHRLTTVVQSLMMGFAELTGLFPSKGAVRRYLWTDAFAVCNFLELHSRTGNQEYRELALRLVDQVHNVLGRHREDDARRGWISGLGEEGGKNHPTAGGLRIGKRMNERDPSDPFDEALEWDRDGQYYHYLTKWMHALCRVSRVTGDPLYNRWGVELAKAAHGPFTYVTPAGAGKRIYWKMSIDLSYPLVDSMGLHDPLDGLITYSALQSTARRHLQAGPADLTEPISDMAQMCAGKNFATDDPLGIGGLLSDGYRAAQLIAGGDFEYPDILNSCLDASLQGLRHYEMSGSQGLPAEHRLAFRELGLSIGLRAALKLMRVVKRSPDRFTSRESLFSKIESLERYAHLIDNIESFWLQPASRSTGTWTDHREINTVMLATSLAPDAYLTI